MPTQRWTLIVVCVATAMLMLDIAVVNTALPQIAHDLHSGLSGVEWVIDACTLALAAVVISAGSLSDRFGRRLIFAIGMGLFIAASLGCALAGSMAVLDGARAIQGIGAAMLFASLSGCVIEWRTFRPPSVMNRYPTAPPIADPTTT